MKLFMHSIISLILTFLTSSYLLAQTFDHNHTVFDEILNDCVKLSKGTSSVDYKKIKANVKKLNNYLDSLSNVKPIEYQNFTKKQKLSFLINAYNAFTISLIVENYPVSSIKKLGTLLTSPWKKVFFKFLGKDSSLDFIEHETIRKNFKEPRIHFAVVCASVGCPSLRNEAYIATKLEEQLEDSAKVFINHKARNYFDKSSNTFYLSKIFDWYGSDFGNVQKFVAKRMNLLDDNQVTGKEKISFLSYDWSLNETK